MVIPYKNIHYLWERKDKKLKKLVIVVEKMDCLEENQEAMEIEISKLIRMLCHC